jgi:hypothetical protein
MLGIAGSVFYTEALPINADNRVCPRCHVLQQAAIASTIEVGASHRMELVAPCSSLWPRWLHGAVARPCVLHFLIPRCS